jgi:hypothetical protein
MPRNKFFETACSAKDRTVSDEYNIGSTYEHDEVKRSVVHTRHDIILLVSLLAQSALLLDSIKIRLNIIIGILILTLLTLGYKIN